jgi:hypothetical protein
MIDSTHEDLTTREDLVGFFEDLTDHPGFSFRGLKVEINGIGVLGNLMIAFLVPQILDLIGRVSDAKLRKPGTYLRFVFPSPLAADLLLESTRETKSDQSSFDDCFFLDAADMDTVHAHLTHEMQRALLELSRRYYIRMTDYFIEFGPMGSSSEITADDVLLLAKALPQL